MKQRIITFLGSVWLGCLLLSGIGEGRSSGAPIGSSGAPGEHTCGKAGCHIGDNGANNINTGPGVLSISSTQDITSYVAGQTYDISVAIEQGDIERFGFLLTALDENNNKAGDLVVEDTYRTQIIDGVLSYQGREYITYKMPGTEPYQAGKGLWHFKWKAPEQPVGSITFYAAAVAANNDGTDQGDQVYTNSIRSETGTTGTLNQAKAPKGVISIYPNPVSNILYIKPQGQSEIPTSVSIVDNTGKTISLTHLMKTDNGMYSLPIGDLNLPTGIYYLHIGTINGFSTVHAISLIH